VVCCAEVILAHNVRKTIKTSVDDRILLSRNERFSGISTRRLHSFRASVAQAVPRLLRSFTGV
jgi:hypothetical protein